MRTLDALRANWPFKALSIVVAILLWVYVLGAENPEDTQGVKCPVVAQNVSTELEVVGITPDTVEVRVKGREYSFEHANFEHMRMVADLKAAEAGAQTVSLSPDGVPAGLRVLPGYTASATIKLDKIEQREKPVHHEQRGQPARGYTITGISVEPEEVTVRGAVSRVHDVRHVAAVVNISGINSTTAIDADLEARDNYDVPVTGLKFKPEQVKVRVEVKRVNTKTVPVRPQIGSPPSGWQVSAVESSPPVVTITAGGELLDGISSIATVPVRISGLRGTKSYRIALSAPAKLSVLDQGSVLVTVTTQRLRTRASEPEPPPEESPSEAPPTEEETPPTEPAEEPEPTPEEPEPPPGDEEPAPAPDDDDDTDTPAVPEDGGTP